MAKNYRYTYPHKMRVALLLQPNVFTCYIFNHGFFPGLELSLTREISLVIGTLPSLINNPGRLFIFEILPPRVGLIRYRSLNFFQGIGP